jgi:hypothetical protein
MYERIEVWKRTEGGYAIRFQCVMRLSDRLFAVQNADFFRQPISESMMASSDQRFVELFLDDDPSERCEVWCASLAEAISEQESLFSGIS